MFPVYDPYSAIVYSADASNVDSVWVDGRQLVKATGCALQTFPQNGRLWTE